MSSLIKFFQSALSLVLRTLGLATTAPAAPTPPSVVDYYDPRTRGGSFLNKSGSGGEPLNVIISGRSTPEVLTPSGFLNFARACGMTYRQDGPDANSGALFLAVSQEEDLAEHHNIVPDGYNIGRDKFVKAAVGTTSYFGITYETSLQDLAGFLTPGDQGVNHGELNSTNEHWSGR
ncbi:hypothetical protein DXG01_003894 [Tephrocybe rancida]|nr:hypothetical protein DXG01_003894 [Tephrocybe rancida]